MGTSVGSGVAVGSGVLVGVKVGKGVLVGVKVGKGVLVGRGVGVGGTYQVVVLWQFEHCPRGCPTGRTWQALHSVNPV